MSENIVWTTKYCPFCDKAKQLMEDNGLVYETRLVDNVKWTLNDMLGYAPNATTYPQVFIGKQHIGGSDELETHFSVQGLSL